MPTTSRVCLPKEPWLGPGSQVENSQLSQSIGRAPLLAGGSRLCPSLIPILCVRLCQGCVCSAHTGIWAVQVGGGVGRGGGSAGCGSVWRVHRQAQLLRMVVRPCTETRAGQDHKQGFEDSRDGLVRETEAGTGTCPKPLSQSSEEPGLLTPIPSTSGITPGL